MALCVALRITTWKRPLPMPSHISQSRRGNSQDIIVQDRQYTRTIGKRLRKQREGYRQFWLEELGHQSWKNTEIWIMRKKRRSGTEESQSVAYAEYCDIRFETRIKVILKECFKLSLISLTLAENSSCL